MTGTPSWPCADGSRQTGHAEIRTTQWVHRCPSCGHVACRPGPPCETCTTNRRIDQLIGDQR